MNCISSAWHMGNNTVWEMAVPDDCRRRKGCGVKNVNSGVKLPGGSVLALYWLDVWSYRSHLSSLHLHSLICHFRVLNDLIQVKRLWNREALLYTSVHYYSESFCYREDFLFTFYCLFLFFVTLYCFPTLVFLLCDHYW